MSDLVQLQVARHGEPVAAGDVDLRKLERALGDVVEGDVRFDRGSRAVYSTDASNYRQVPIGVVLPKSKEDVVRAVEVCRRHGAPVLGRGGGTSLAGQCCNVAVVFDFTRYMNRVLAVDPERRLARVQPGCILDDLREATARSGLTFGPDPSTHDRCAVGGMIGNNSCGMHSVHAQWYHGARTSDNLSRLEVLTWDGARFWVGETSEQEWARIEARGDRQAEIYSMLRSLVETHEDDIRGGFPDIPRRVSGFNLDDLLPENGRHVGRALTGTEGTCVLYLEAELHLIPDPPARTLVVLGYPNVYEAADDVPQVMEHRPLALEGMDERLMQFMEIQDFRTQDLTELPPGDAFLLVELGGEDQDEADAEGRALAEAFGNGSGDRSGGGDRHERSADDGSNPPERARSWPSVTFVDDPAQAEKIWKVREAGLGATAFVEGMDPTWPGWEDTAVHPEDFGDYLRDFRALMDRYGYEGSFYGHFGQGLLHVRISFDLETHRGIETYMRFSRDCADLVQRYDGSLSGEHGDGQSRAALLSHMYGPELMDAFRTFKAIWDPQGKMNPGKVVDAYRPDTNLVFGADWVPPVEPEQQFAFANDGFVFHQAPKRCVGVGKCRRKGGGTMCPSYMVTLEEEHSTRGRARALFEMLRGEVIEDGWRSADVHRVLDLCLSCKGCKSDCPVDVDMATYKAEFAYHHWKGRLRPRHAYAMGWIHWWARLGSTFPALANWAMGNRLVAKLLRWAGQIHPDRDLPRLSMRTFRRAWRDHVAERRGDEALEVTGSTYDPSTPRDQPAKVPVRDPNPDARKVIFWADTFNNHFHAETAMAGARVLEALGYRVHVPQKPLCCGRPLYDFGFLGMAKRLWSDVLDALEDDIAAGVPVVGVEPSCVAAFRDELVELFPHDVRARRLAGQTFMLSEFLERHAPDVELPRVGGRALLHGHCHQKAVLDFGADRRLLERLGVEHEAPDSGCCGMAGPFGFNEDHYDVAQECAERVLLPGIREMEDGAMVVTDGFSCREMIRQNLGVRALNTAEVLWRALEDRERPPRGRSGAVREERPIAGRGLTTSGTRRQEDT